MLLAIRLTRYKASTRKEPPRDYAEKEECSSTEQTQSADAHPSNVAWQQRPLSTSPRALRPTSHAQTAIPDQNFSNHEGQHDLPSAPSDVDRRYIMRSRQWQIVTGADSAEVLVAPVTDDQHNDDIPEVSDDPEDAMTAMAEDVKIDGTFRRIYIRYDNDPEGRLAQTQCIMHDTGAGCSLTFASKLKELGLDYEPLRFRRPLRSLNGDPFYPIGKKQICFSYNGKGDKKHWTDVFVLADPPEEWEPAFDMLFGRDTIKKVKAIGWNHDVIGDTIHHLQTLDLTFPSLISSSPPVSICPRPESRTGIAVAEREAI